MYACVLLVCAVALTDSVEVRYREPSKPDAKQKEELPPLLITCNLNDIVTISAPVPNKTNALYYLYKPNGDVTQLNINTIKLQNYGDKGMYLKDGIEWSKSDYKVTNVNLEYYNASTKTKDVFVWKENQFVIGPVSEEEHGNWVLSVYYKNNDTWIETFQVITIEIIEAVPIQPQLADLNAGDTLEISFAYPIKDLQSCQLIVPSHSFDRFYERHRSDSCAFVVRNVTEDDIGTWGIVGVGRIVYTGSTLLTLKNKVT